MENNINCTLKTGSGYNVAEQSLYNQRPLDGLSGRPQDSETGAAQLVLNTAAKQLLECKASTRPNKGQAHEWFKSYLSSRSLTAKTTTAENKSLLQAL